MADLQVSRISLVGGGRSISFNDGLSVVRGEIATGKTTLLRLIRGLLGAKPSKLPPETKAITALAGTIATSQGTFDVVRPFVSTPTAPVDISGNGETLRLPAAKPTKSSSATYNDWLLAQLGIPNISVPSRRSTGDGTFVAVTINDWLNYCFLPGSEIDVAVFGHKEPFRDIKRRYVFELNYGLYDVAVAELQARLRALDLRANQISAQTEAARVFLSGTPFSNQADLQQQLERALRRRARLEAAGQELVTRSESLPGVERLRNELSRVDAVTTRGHSRVLRIQGQLTDLDDLAKDLRSQVNRANRAIVAGERLLDIEFVICPRCGNDVTNNSRDSPDHCRLCLQEVQVADNRDSMIRDLDRLHAQLDELTEVSAARREELQRVQDELSDLEVTRARIARELDYKSSSFVSSNSEQIADVAAARATVQGDIQRFEEYLELYAKDEVLAEEMLLIQSERDEIQSELDSRSESGALSLVADVEHRLSDYLRRLRIPSLGSTKTRLNPITYMPEVGGRSFDALSSQGLATLINVAHALAHHTVSIDQELPLPGFLVMDGLSSNIGREDFDAERVADMYRLISNVCREYAGHLQVIVFDNDPPDFVANDIVLDLRQDEKLIVEHLQHRKT